VLLSNSVIKLADFGASKRLTNASLVDGLKGTPHWMAPEVIRAQQTTEGWFKADVWSVGCTVLEMATGTVLILCAYCTHTLYTHTVLILYSHCAHTVLILCTLILYSHCTHTVLILYPHRTHTVLTPFSHHWCRRDALVAVSQPHDRHVPHRQRK
jgi:serine/threonine protein kinase